MLSTTKNKLTISILKKLRNAGMPGKVENIEVPDILGMDEAGEQEPEEVNPSGEVVAKSLLIKKPKKLK
jgi:hypothetical protein